MNKLLSLAVLLLVIWLILRVALATAGFLLNVLWVLAGILVILWIIGKFRGKS